MKRIQFLSMIASALSAVALFPGCGTTGGTAVRTLPVPAPDRPVRVACVGDSITFGHGLADPASQGYPAAMGRQMGTGYDVRGFAVSGTTVQRGGTLSVWDLPTLREAAAFAPDIVVIHLGTNDSKRIHWKSRSAFVREYSELVDYFQALPSKPVVLACLPIPVFEDNSGLRAQTLSEGVVPAINQVARAKNIRVIDLYSALAGRPDLTLDGVHPTETGSIRMAKLIAREIQA